MHHFGTIDGQIFIVEEEEAIPVRENFLKSEDPKVNQRSKFMQELDNQLEKVKELYKFLNLNLNDDLLNKYAGLTKQKN